MPMLPIDIGGMIVGGTAEGRIVKSSSDHQRLSSAGLQY